MSFVIWMQELAWNKDTNWITLTMSDVSPRQPQLEFKEEFVQEVHLDKQMIEKYRR